MSSQPVVYTFCLNSDDARVDEDGDFNFELGQAVASLEASKLILSSFEFPVSQYPIDERNGRLYIREDVALPLPAKLCVDEHWRDEHGHLARRRCEVCIPAAVNQAVRAEAVENEGILLTFAHPHCLFSNGRLCISVGDGAPVHFVGISTDVPSTAIREVDERTLRLQTLLGPSEFEQAALVCSGTGDLSRLCAALQARLALWPLHATVSFETATGTVCLKFAKGSAQARGRGYGVELSGSALGLLGMSPTRKEASAPPRAPQTSILSIPDRCDDVTFRSGAALFEHVALTPGWYAPCHRSFCPSQPRRMRDEVSGQLNRLHLFPAETEHVVAMQIAGDTVLVPLMNGVHDADSLCAAFSASHARVRGRGGAVVTLSYDRRDARFTFSAVWGADGSECIFDLLFSHPDSIDGERLGFGDDNLYGQSSYASTSAVRVAALANHYGLRETEGQTKFVLRASPLPVIGAIVRSAQGGTITVSTYLANRPFACNAGLGRVAIVSSATEVFHASDVDEDGAPTDVHGAVGAMRGSRRGFVTVCDGHLMTLHVGRVASIRVGSALCVSLPPCPFSVSSGLLPASLGRQLGFPKGVLSCARGDCVIAAPNVYDLDHVDYVLLYLSDIPSVSTSLIHQVGNSVTTPFVKLVMYPSMREERMLPRELSLAAGCRLRRLKLGVRNPDGSRYAFNGAHFSLSLSSVCAA